MVGGGGHIHTETTYMDVYATYYYYHAQIRCLYTRTYCFCIFWQSLNVVFVDFSIPDKTIVIPSDDPCAYQSIIQAVCLKFIMFLSKEYTNMDIHNC